MRLDASFGKSRMAFLRLMIEISRSTETSPKRGKQGPPTLFRAALTEDAGGRCECDSRRHWR